MKISAKNFVQLGSSSHVNSHLKITEIRLHHFYTKILLHPLMDYTSLLQIYLPFASTVKFYFFLWNLFISFLRSLSQKMVEWNFMSTSKKQNVVPKFIYNFFAERVWQ